MRNALKCVNLQFPTLRMQQSSYQIFLLLSLCAAVAAGAAGCRRLVKSHGPVALDAGVGSSVSDAELAASPQDCALRCVKGFSDCALAAFNSRSRLCRTLRLLDAAQPLSAGPDDVGHVTRLLGSEEGDEVWLAEDFWQMVERLRQSSSVSASSQSTTEAPPKTSAPATRLPAVSPGYEQQIGGRTFWVFQQRQTGQVAFNRTWSDYVSGFGNAVEFWVGLERIHNMSSTGNRNLRIEAVTVDEEFYKFEWLSFTVGDSGSNYRMDYSSFVSGNSTINCDFLLRNRGQQFSTIDRDNDIHADSCCTMYGSGGYWWEHCMNSNPNGLYSSTLISDSTKTSHMGTACIGSYKTLLAMRMMLQV